MNNQQTESDLLVQVDNDKTQRLQHINTQMKDIHQGMTMLNDMTKTQQTVIDQLEINYQNADDYTTQSVFEIDKAGNSQKAGDRKNLLIACALIVIVLVLFLIIYIKLR
ncbi:hypothetical protein EIN_081710 [Entamoeba invadens IP1]|uniref:hypothetical protein n=1 Tax=Entamoeba invadens IP1 TaxID=370355 RepID=UPI0002C3E19F|nr:hypothetical protein EIN_081710 [Entamoeba invadens IP1]ELP85139.1 hypothetical protein EIN_081710 [Entamoeba invadens IP1]|eukprot:XP_004184485.1 hypothetical protein EIN_081710 [Entamoeba invadens IP1]